jgi:hypothetical protein
MRSHSLATLAAGSPFPKQHAHLLNVFMLQTHVVLASVWAICAILSALIAIPQLRRVPSALGLHVLQIKSELLLNVTFGTYVLTAGTGIWLIFKQAIYDPPASGSDWTTLKHEPYGFPYYATLYTKIGIFLLMGLATYVLATEAKRAGAESEAAGGPVDYDLDDDDDTWLDEEVLPEGTTDDLGMSGAAETATLTETRAVTRRRLATAATSPIALWASVAVIGLGLGGVGFCVTLIKYFHELSKSAVVYQILSGNTGMQGP